MHIHHILAVGQMGLSIPEFKRVAFRQAFQFNDHVGGQGIGFALQRNGVAAFCDVQKKKKNP